jgi:hypothetical protein
MDSRQRDTGNYECSEVRARVQDGVAGVRLQTRFANILLSIGVRME